MARSIEWVAGLLEGEGCFGANKNNRGKWYPRVQCLMSDEDVVRELHDAVGFGSVGGPYIRNPAHKPCWRWCGQGYRALDLMTQLRPLMGNRRGQKIDDLVVRFGPQ